LGAAAQQTVSPTATTTYNVSGTDVNGCLDSMAVTVTVHPLPIVDAGTDILICDGSTVTFTATGANTYAWDNGIFNGIPFAPTQSTTYTVTGTNIYGCVDTDSVNVTVEPNPVVVFQADLLAGCEPLTTNLSNLTAGNFNDCVWIISTGDTLNGCGPLPYTFTNAGLYDVTLIVTSQHGCVGTATYADYIYVEADPIASFGAQTNGLDIFNTTLSYNNTSINAVSYIWNFNDGSALSTDENPTHTFPELTAGTFITELVAFSELGCTDTAWMSIPIEDELLYYVPNTFTPDDDEFNQTFFPVFSGNIDPYNYTMYIYNRWGELIFESHNVDVGWDGTYAGRSVSDGTYTWKIVFKTDKTKETTAIHGHVNVIK
jgi:gliding motility-associated-like protein